MFDGEVNRNTQMKFDVATAAIKGAQIYQEDSMIASFPMGQGAGFAIVADGIGDHAAGQLASALLTTEMFHHLKMQEGQLLCGALEIPFALQAATALANQRVAAQAKTDAEARAMGSTLLVPVISQDRLFWISVGGSPLFLVRDGVLRHLNEDDPSSKTLATVMTGAPIKEIDCPSVPVKLKSGDIIVAATDGLRYLPNSVIANILTRTSDAPAVDLVNGLLRALKALNHPDQDNASFAVIKVDTPLI